MLTPKKHLGQHFLSDPNTARKIIAALKADPGDQVIEIGPGAGALTGLLSERFQNVTAIEVDPRAARLIEEKHPSVSVILADILTFDYLEMAREAGSQLHVIGNLPYNITSQILFSLLDATDVVDEAVVMMQYEVAKRIVAGPSTKAYGILSVALQLASTPTFLFSVSPNVFRPKPDVKSAVIRLKFDKSTLTEADSDPAWTRRVIRMAFNQRRKTLRNSLKRLELEVDRQVPDEWAGKRAEELIPGDFVKLARYLQSGS